MQQRDLLWASAVGLEPHRLAASLGPRDKGRASCPGLPLAPPCPPRPSVSGLSLVSQALSVWQPPSKLGHGVGVRWQQDVSSRTQGRGETRGLLSRRSIGWRQVPQTRRGPGCGAVGWSLTKEVLGGGRREENAPTGVSPSVVFGSRREEEPVSKAQKHEGWWQGQWRRAL